ncbi:MAG TPA: response regulator [Candidatus Paceibacterota bacterium]
MAKRILVGEDDSLLSSMIVRRLDAEGYDTEATYDGEQTIKKIRDWKPDLLLLDILMPGKSGYDVLEVMRAEGIHASMHVIILSNLSAKEDIARAQKYGVTDFLVKARTTLAEVAEKVKSVLSAS